MDRQCVRQIGRASLPDELWHRPIFACPQLEEPDLVHCPGDVYICVSSPKCNGGVNELFAALLGAGCDACEYARPALALACCR
ncbi:hypothetical protein D3C81_2205410 [compost metagenome]